MNNKPRVMILCGDGPHHKYLISRLSTTQNVVLAIVEKSTELLKRLAVTGKYKPFYNQLYHRVRRAISGTACYRRKYFSLDEFPEPSTPIIEVNNINDNIVPSSIEQYMPDVIVVMGTSILKENVLTAAMVEGIPIINIHGGCLPYYKGNHCFFFALLNEDFSKIASTIHLIDSGIDSGSVVCRIHPAIYKRDDAEKLYCRAEKDAIQELDKLITRHGSKIASLAIPQQEQGHLYYTKDRTLECEAKMWRVRQAMKKNEYELICPQHIDYLRKNVS